MVFPAYAGVFLAQIDDYTKRGCLPRIRGGVSAYLLDFPFFVLSSPHTRGCFLTQAESGAMCAVFPAYAGVFLAVGVRLAVGLGLPRIRGGVSAGV